MVTVKVKITVRLKVKITVEETGTVVATTLVSRTRLRQLFMGHVHEVTACIFHSKAKPKPYIKNSICLMLRQIKEPFKP